MFQMLFKIVAFSVFCFCFLFVRNVNSNYSSPLPVLYQSGNDTTHQWENNTTHQWGNDTTPTINAETEIGNCNEDFDDYDSTAIVEGDILLEPYRNAVNDIWDRKVVKGGVDGSTRISVPIAYVITGKLKRTHRTAIFKAMKMISDVTCVTFHERKEGDEDDRNYLLFTYHKRGCASYVGCIGGAQLLYVGPHCVKGNVCHEIMHALGLNHEHTRPDHKNYIKIIYKNIVPKMKKNFHAIHGNMLNCEYDTCSIMHYGSKYFSKNGLPTIIELEHTSGNCGLKMGQRTNVTKLDIKKLRTLYNCDGNVEEMANSVPAR